MSRKYKFFEKHKPYFVTYSVINWIDVFTRNVYRNVMLEMMKLAGSSNNNNKGFQFWQQHNHPLILNTNKLIEQKLNYIHNNPVKAGFVDKPEDYLYSSARDYVGIKGLIDIELIEL